MAKRAPNAELSRRLNVLVAAHVRLYRESLVASLSCHQPFLVVSAENHAETLARIHEFAPRVLVVDVAMPDSLAIIRVVHKSSSTKVLAFAVNDAGFDIVECAEAGATGYVTPDVTSDGLIEAIERIARDELVCSPRAAAQLFKRIAEPTDRSGAQVEPTRHLTARELEVLDLISHGQSNKEISVTLSIAESTVKNHVHHVLEKLTVTTRAQAAARTFSQHRRRH